MARITLSQRRRILRPYRMAQDMLDTHASPTLETHEDDQDSKLNVNVRVIVAIYTCMR